MTDIRLLFLVYRIIYMIASLVFLFFTLRSFGEGLLSLKVKYETLNPGVREWVKQQGMDVVRYFLPGMLKRGWPFLLVIIFEFLFWLFLTVGVLKPLS